MSEYILSCCSTADMPKEFFEQKNIRYTCFHYQLGDTWYPDDLGVSVPLPVFYKEMEKGTMTKTSQINAEEYVEYFEQFLKDGKDVLHIALSSGISGTFNSANVARDMLQDKYPDRKIYVVDSYAASSGFGLLMDQLANLRDAGMSMEELRDWTMAHRLEVQHWFFSTTLTYFIRGGRISKTAGTIGNMLNICPLMNVDFEGKLIVRHKIRGKKKVIKAAMKKMAEHAQGGKEYNGKCFISNSACYEDARELADLIEQNFPNLDGKVKICDIGNLIGSHTGPGTVALFFWGDERKD
ncbi:MAG: DegV family protein [Lachnospiraceae bacterium]|nr:DegV family protein [Lachnospiraceae bacterium]